MIEIYTVSKAGNITSSSMYTKAELASIFGETDALKLLMGMRVINKPRTKRDRVAYRVRAFRGRPMS